MAFVVGGDLVGVVHLPEGVDPPEAIFQGQDLHAARGAHIVIAVGALYDGAHRIGGQSPGLVHHVGDALVDADGQAVVVGADPQAAFRVHVEAVHVAHGFIAVHPGELPPVVAVQAGIGADPEDAVVGLGDVVGLATGQAVVAVVDGLHVVVVIDGLGVLLGPGDGHGHSAAQCQRQRQRRQPLCGLVPRAAPARQPDQAHRDEQQHQRQQLVQEFHVELAQYPAQQKRHVPFPKEADHAVAPEIAGAAVV